MEWFGFWMFMSVLVAVDGWLYSKGHTCFIYDHQTDAEKAIRDRLAYGDAPPPGPPESTTAQEKDQ